MLDGTLLGTYKGSIYKIQLRGGIKPYHAKLKTSDQEPRLFIEQKGFWKSLEKYKTMFDGSLGTYKGSVYKIELKDGIKQ